MSRASQLETQHPIKVVVLVLENSQGDILLTQRQVHKHLAGYWEFPGGKVEPGETDLEALKRECLEELNHQVKAAQAILKIHHSYPTISVELLVFQEICTDPHIQTLENQAMQWVKKSKLSQIKLPEANKAIVQFLQKPTT